MKPNNGTAHEDQNKFSITARLILLKMKKNFEQKLHRNSKHTF